MQRALSLLTAIACGLLYGLCFPPLSWWWLSWIVLVPAFVAMRRAPFGQALLLAATLASAGAVATVSWLPRTVSVYFHQPAWVGVLLFAAVTLVMVVPSYVAFAACYKVFSSPPTASLPLLAAAAWVSGEFARSHLFTGNPWVLFGYSQARVGPVVQLADLTGVYGISFVLVVVTTASAESWVTWRDQRRLTRVAMWGLALAAAAVVVTLGYGWSRLRGGDALALQQPTVEVAVVQGNLDLGSQWRQDFYGKNLDAYGRLTLPALRARHVHLIFWPENAMTFFLEREPAYQYSLRTLLEPWDAELVAGGPHVGANGTDIYYLNSAFAVSAQGSITGRYDKQRLLPFAEYFPLPQLDFLKRDFGRVREFMPGEPSGSLQTRAGPAGVLICNEALFPEVARARARDGAVYLVNLTNDTWVRDPQFALIAFDMSVLRAVEERRYLVRASTWGPSAIVDPFGRVHVETRLSSAETAVGAIAPRTALSPYGRLGDGFAAGCGVLTVAALAWRRSSRGRVARNGPG
jgi:apolipoprotein N-acyltransferase